jgi:hypothetical protein
MLARIDNITTSGLDSDFSTIGLLPEYESDVAIRLHHFSSATKKNQAVTPSFHKEPVFQWRNKKSSASCPSLVKTYKIVRANFIDVL